MSPSPVLSGSAFAESISLMLLFMGSSFMSPITITLHSGSSMRRESLRALTWRPATSR